jgi:hypothetical protein
MTRLESAVWPLAGGGVCVFAVAAVLSGAPWQVTLAVLAVVVAVWSLRAPLLVSVALGGMAWLLVTGFDVNADGDLRFAGRDDVFRLVVLVVSGLAGLAVGWLLGGTAASRRVDDMPGPPEEYVGLGVYESSGVSGARYHHPVMVSPRLPRGHAWRHAATVRARDERAHRAPEDPADSTKESRDD